MALLRGAPSSVDPNSADPVAVPSPELSVVIPLYNEADSVVPLLQAIASVRAETVRQSVARVSRSGSPENATAASRLPPRTEVILVDDGSGDETYRRAVEAAPDFPLPLRVISLGRNFGQTAAMQAGIEASSGRLIATLDGDLQNDPADIPRLVERLERDGLDLVVGRRMKRRDGLWLRLIPSWLANRLIARVTGVRIHDYGCSLKVYRGSIIRQVRLMGEMHRFIPAWVALVTHPSRIGELGVRHHARQFGRSKYGISRAFRVVLDLLSVLFFMKYRMRPGHFFGSLGMTVGAVGGVMLGTVFISKLVFGEDIGTRPMLLMGAFAMLSSLQLICFGVMAEMLSRIQYEAGDRPTYCVRESFDHQPPGSAATRRVGMRVVG